MSCGHIGFYNALRKLGAFKPTAQTAVDDLPMAQHVATREDLLQAVGQVKADLAILQFVSTLILGLLLTLVFFG